MSEITHLSNDGGPSTHETYKAPSTVYPECWETTQSLKAKEARARGASQNTLHQYQANPCKRLLKMNDKAHQESVATRTNRELHSCYHELSGRVGANEPCDWQETHDSKGNRIAATTIERMTPSVPPRPDGVLTNHTCHGKWVGSGRLTEVEERSLTQAELEYTVATRAVRRTRYAISKNEPGAEEDLKQAEEKKRTAFFIKDGLLASLQDKYRGCSTCQSEAISASECEERFPPSPKPSQISDDEYSDEDDDGLIG